WTAVQRRLGQALGLAGAVGLASWALLAWQPARMAGLLYGEPQIAGQVRVLALSSPFAYVNHTLTAALLGLGETRTPLVTFRSLDRRPAPPRPGPGAGGRGGPGESGPAGLATRPDGRPPLR